jgi:HopA1 effector protein family
MDAKLTLNRAQRRVKGSPAADPSAQSERPSAPGGASPPSLGTAATGFRPRQVMGDAGASAQRYQPRSAPAEFTAPDSMSAVADRPLTGTTLALTQGGGTSFSPAVQGHPREREIVAHEAVHRAQFAAAGERPVGDTPQLEAEARSGSRRLMRGLSFEPRLSAPDDAALAYDYASVGEHLNLFVAWLAEHTDFDTDAIDWPTMVTDMKASTRIFSEEDEDTAVELSDLYRYRMLLEIFEQEMASAEEVATPAPPAPPLVIPTLELLEDTLFDLYMPTLSASDFDPADVENASDAFLEHWLSELELLEFVPTSFDLEAYRPEPRTDEVNDERLRILDEWFQKNVQNLMFKFMLDDFARAIGGPHASVRRLAPILGGGEARSLTAEHWLETLDLPAYKERLVDYLTGVFMAHLGKDAVFRRLMRSQADETSRFESLRIVHLILSGQGRSIEYAAKSLREDAYEELDESDTEIANDPGLHHKRMSKVSAASLEFYRDIGPALDNDEELIKVLERLVAALTDIEALGAGFALLIRLSRAIDAFKTQVEDQRRRTREDIEARVQVSYDDIAAGIKEMGKYATDYIDNTFIPKLHEVALKRITANVVLLRDRYEHWEEYSSTSAASLEAQATLFEDIARGLRDGDYDTVELSGETITTDDAKRLEDVAAIMRAEVERLRNPRQSKKGKDKLKEALDGFEDVKERIEAKEENPTVYGRDVYIQARQELGIDTFPEFTTYGDIIFGRVTAGANPFLARLVIAWEMVDKIDENLKRFTILAGLLLLTVASLLAGPIVGTAALALGASAGTATALAGAAGIVLFAIDAIIAIGLGVHDVTEAQALLRLVRLDLDHSVTGVSEEDAERALTMAWVGLALAITAVAVGVGVMLYFRFARGGVEVTGLSLRYYKLIREDPELFNSLRAIIGDSTKLDRFLNLTADAAELQQLLHRMDATLDLARVERLLEVTGDAGKTSRMLDLAVDAEVLETSLSELRFFTGADDVAFQNLLASSDDVAALLNVLTRSEDLAAAQAMIEAIPDVVRLSNLLSLAENTVTLRGLIDALGDVGRVATLLEAGGVGSGPRLLRVIELPGATGLADDAVVTLANLDVESVQALRTATSPELAQIAALAQQDGPAVNRLLRIYGSPVASPAGTVTNVTELEAAVAQSRARLESFLDLVWAQRADIAAGRKSVYSLYARTAGNAPLTRTESSYLTDLADVARTRPPDAVSHIQGVSPLRDGDQISAAVAAANADPTQLPNIRSKFYMFYRAGTIANQDLVVNVGNRIYVNVVADEAPTVMRAIVQDIVDKPGAYPGVAAAKLTGPGGVVRRADAIVIYLENENATYKVLDWLRDYAQRNPTVFQTATPHMTSPVAPGVSVGAEPILPVAGSGSFGSVRSDAINTAVVEAVQGGLTRDQFAARVDELLRAAQVDPALPHANLPP